MIAAELPGEWDVCCHRVVERFRSKKNDVYRLEVTGSAGHVFSVVGKDFRTAEACRREGRLLGALRDRGARVPELFHCGDSSMIMEYIRGPLLLDVMFGDRALQHIAGLATALGDIYGALDDMEAGMILGDMNLRNFIVREGVGDIFRVDLESVTRGRVEDDVGRLCAFCLSYDPPFTAHKRRLTASLFRSVICWLGLDADVTKLATQAELSAIERRRGVEVPGTIRRAVDRW